MLAGSFALSSAVAGGADLRTLAERSNYTQTPRYAETFECFNKLDALSEHVKAIEFGTSPQGRKQFALVIASNGEFTPSAAKASGKPVMLIQACIHADENEGNVALMALSREWLIEAKQKAALDGAGQILVASHAWAWRALPHEFALFPHWEIAASMSRHNLRQWATHRRYLNFWSSISNEPCVKLKFTEITGQISHVKFLLRFGTLRKTLGCPAKTQKGRRGTKLVSR